MPSTVGTSLATIVWSYQRKSFYASGLFWVFYCDGDKGVYRTSSDGEEWSDATEVREGEIGVDNLWCIFFDGTYLHYAYADDDMGDPLLYRRGKPNSDGTITWSAAEQTAVAGASGVIYWFPSIAVDSDGYPFIAYRRGEPGVGSYPYVTKSSKNDGTWTTDSGFPYQLSTTSSASWQVALVALTASRMYALYAKNADTIKGCLWDGSSWGSEETCTSSDTHTGRMFSATNEDDDIHLVFLKWATYDILYVKYTYGTGWGSEDTVESGTTSTSAPVLSIDGEGNLYCFWVGSPTADHIYYKKCLTGTWDTDPTDWLDESTDGFLENDRLTCYYAAYGEKIGLAYTTKTSSPYNVKHQFIYSHRIAKIQRMSMMIHSGL